MLDIATPIIGALAQMANWFADLPKDVKVVAVAIAGLVAAVGPLLVIVGGAITLWGSLSAAFAAIGTVLAPLAGIFATVVGVLTSWPVVLGAVLLAIKPVREFLFELGSKVINMVVIAAKKKHMNLNYLRQYFERVEPIPDIVIMRAGHEQQRYHLARAYNLLRRPNQ